MVIINGNNIHLIRDGYVIKIDENKERGRVVKITVMLFSSD